MGNGLSGVASPVRDGADGNWGGQLVVLAMVDMGV